MLIVIWLWFNYAFGVEYSKYFRNFIEYGYDSLQRVGKISNVGELQDIGIKNTEHQTEILKVIKQFQSGNKVRILNEMENDDTFEG